MLFNRLEYAVFFLVVFPIYWATVRRRWFPTLFLLVASYVFYACWNPRYLILIFASASIDFFLSRAMGRETRPGRRKFLLVLSLFHNLGVLAVFKYFNFFMDSTDSVLVWLGLAPLGARLDFLLPVGISFFTFHSMSYTIDVYRGLAPIGTYWHFLLSVSFFPQLVAGPIVRAADLLPQFVAKPALDDRTGGRALFLIAVGLVKKVAIADTLALNLVDRTFDLPHQFGRFEALAGVYGYALQIYCDFSGYSDIAIGSALLLGITFPKNFDSPYQSQSLQEFWRRWHISLSSWLRDYLYIGLGGNRGGRWKTTRNLLLTMLLGGLWHGAAWTFVIWGALHGGALAASRAFEERRKRLGRPLWPAGPWGDAVRTLLTFHFVCLAWVFFRAPDLAGALAVLRQIATGGPSLVNLSAPVLGVMLLGFATHALPQRLLDRIGDRFVVWPAAAQAAALLAVVLVLGRLATQDVVPFIYFQF